MQACLELQLFSPSLETAAGESVCYAVASLGWRRAVLWAGRRGWRPWLGSVATWCTSWQRRTLPGRTDSALRLLTVHYWSNHSALHRARSTVSLTIITHFLSSFCYASNRYVVSSEQSVRTESCFNYCIVNVTQSGHFARRLLCNMKDDETREHCGYIRNCIVLNSIILQSLGGLINEFHVLLYFLFPPYAKYSLDKVLNYDMKQLLLKVNFWTPKKWLVCRCIFF